jgi:type I restriction enzyme S subunit
VSAWPDVALGEIFDVSSSKRVLQSDWKTSGVPFYRAREIVKLARDGLVDNELFISEELYVDFAQKYGAPRAGDIMVSAVGTLGACYVVQPNDRFYFKDASVLRFRAKREICPQFFSHAFRTNHVLDQVHAGSGSTVGTYTIERANSTRLRVPPLEEQRRIAAILDQAETLRTQRRLALAHLDTLTQSLFLDMFGDPVANDNGWPDDLTLGEVAEIASGVTKGRNLEGKVTRELPYLAVANVQDKSLRLDGIKSIEATEDEIQRYLLRKNDLLLTEGGDPDKLGRGTLWNDELPECIHQNHIFRVRLNTDLLTPLFLNWLVGSTRGKKYFLRSAKQTTGIASINMTQLKGFPVLVPPLPLQQTFATRIAAIEALKATHRSALAQLDALFASLQQRAFAGELTARVSPPLSTPQGKRDFADLGRLDATKGLEALVYAAWRLRGKGHYWATKTMYIADRRHLERHGRTVYGETHVAMPHGPVPQAAFNASRALERGELICEFPMDAVRAALRREGDQLIALRDADTTVLGTPERESLDWAIRYVQDMNFAELKMASHDAAWEKTLENAPIPWEDIIRTLPPEAQQRFFG